MSHKTDVNLILFVSSQHNSSDKKNCPSIKYSVSIESLLGLIVNPITKSQKYKR